MKQYINHLYYKRLRSHSFIGVCSLINQLIRPNCLDVKNIPIIINNRNRLTYVKIFDILFEKGYNNLYY